MGKILTIELPDEVYNSLKKLSNGGSDREIGDQLVRIVKGFVDEKKRLLSDPIFEPITDQGSGVSDISERHDKYLYHNLDRTN